MQNLTSMQTAYWFGRQSKEKLGGVAAYLYAEFLCGSLEIPRLEAAVKLVLEKQPMLRVKITEDGLQHVDNNRKNNAIICDDLTSLGSGERENFQSEKRNSWTHGAVAPESDSVFAISVTKRTSEECILHVKADMIAVDPNSFRIFIEQLAAIYDGGLAGITEPETTFFDWLKNVENDGELAVQMRLDRQYWQEKLSAIAPVPELPQSSDSYGTEPANKRYSCMLNERERESLAVSARELRVTTSSLSLALFAYCLGKALGQQCFRINVPMFWRNSYDHDVDSIIGEFTNVLILSVDLKKPSNLQELIVGIHDQLIEMIDHSSYPGVNLMRDLSRYHGSAQTAPIVFTAALDISGGELFSERVKRTFGKLNYVISQGPHVALDAQLAAHENGLLVNWDARLDALPEEWVEAFFKDFVASLKFAGSKANFLNKALNHNGLKDDDDYTSQMIVFLLKRLGLQLPSGTDITFQRMTLTPSSEQNLIKFINQHIPNANISTEILKSLTTTKELSELLRQRSNDESETIAQVFLQAVNLTS